MKTVLRLLLAIAAGFAGANAADEPPWEIVRSGSTKIAVPKGWRTFDRIEPQMLIYRQGDGINVPAYDETGAPLQIGITVEKLQADRQDTETIARAIAKGASEHLPPGQTAEHKFEDVELPDGSRGTLVVTEFKKGASRRSFYQKLVTKSSNDDVWVATGYIVGGSESEWPTPRSPLAAWLRAHLLSLSVSGADLPPPALAAAYEKLRSAAAVQATPTFDATGRWTGRWQGASSPPEEFVLELKQSGSVVTGTATFKDAAGTRASVTGEASGPKIRLVMTPSSPSLPKTFWAGTVTDRRIAGTWSVPGASGIWNAEMVRGP